MHIATLLAGFCADDIEVRGLRRPRPSNTDRVEVYAREESSHCAYCATILIPRSVGQQPGQLADSWRTLDHVVPVAAGGANTAANLVAACSGCNRHKGDVLLAEFLASAWLAARRKTVARRAARTAVAA